MCFSPEEKETLRLRLNKLEAQHNMLRGMGLVVATVATLLGGFIVSQLSNINSTMVQAAVIQADVKHMSNTLNDLKILQGQNNAQILGISNRLHTLERQEQ